MTWDLNFLLGLVAGPAAKFTKAKVKEGLQKWHDSDKDAYTAAVLAFYPPAKILLEKVVHLTKTDADDTVLEEGLLAALTESMTENGIDIPVIPGA